MRCLDFRTVCLFLISALGPLMPSFAIAADDDMPWLPPYLQYVSTKSAPEQEIYGSNTGIAIKCAQTTFRNVLASTSQPTLRKRLDEVKGTAQILASAIINTCRAIAMSSKLYDEKIWMQVENRFLMPLINQLIAESIDIPLHPGPMNEVTSCDTLASNPSDKNKPMGAVGVTFGKLQRQAAAAIDACQREVARNPMVPRFQYQLARALQSAGLPGAEYLLEALVRNKYTSAYDNLATIYLSKSPVDYGRVAVLLREAVAQNDPNGMIQLADLIVARKISARSSIEPEFLYRRAAEIGHAGAQKALARYNAQYGTSASDARFWEFIANGGR